MRCKNVALSLLVALVATAGTVSAQSTTGTISGRVIDTQDRTVPGVTVTVESPSLQGVRTAVTSENGDYIVSLLPPGAYTVTFELSGFQRQQRVVTLAPTQVLPVDVTMGPAAVSETVEVIGRSAAVLTQTAQVATNFSQDLIATLPTNRDINAVLLLAPAVHPTGPGGNYSIAGSMSFENLFMINGVSVNENLRGQPNTLYVEDAIQETTIATAGVSAEYGRFNGGVVNMITKSGGNTFSGSFRDTLLNDDWRTLVPKRAGDPFANDTKLDAIVPTYEYTFGGPIARDRLWFFTAGRFQTQKQARQLVQTNIPYTFTQKSRRYEGNATYSLTSNHRFQGTVIKEQLEQLNNTFNLGLSMDERSLEDRSTPQDIFTLSYSGVLTPSFFLEARGSKRNFTFIGSGSKSTDIVDGTLLLDRNRGNLRYWAATFCGVCTPEERDNEDIYLKASYFLSSPRYGSHNFVAGFDSYNDIRKANNRQSGSDYRIFGTTSIITPSNEIFPVFLNDGTTYVQWNPIPILSEGSNFITNSAFFNDNWRVTNRLTANLGLRFDKNNGKNQEGELVAKDSAWSPRLGIVLDPTGAGEWSVTASYARYVAAVANSIADSSSKAGNPQTWQYIYRGPNINATGPTTPPAEAVRQFWAWFQGASGCAPMPDQTCQPNLPLRTAPNLPGVAARIGDSLTTPNNFEYAAGVSRNFGARAALRADYVFRDYKDFYVSRTDLSTGKTTDQTGRTFDIELIENSNIYKRRYSGLTTQATYRFNSRTDVGGTYTLSRAWGNLDGENFNSGPLTGGATFYPEYREARWNYPEGNIGVDQRHRARLWVNYGVPMVEGLTLSLLQALETGIPFQASQNIDPSPFVTNPGYATPTTETTYFFTVDCANVPSRVTDLCVGGRRGSFDLEGQKRTDLAINYRYSLNAGGHTFPIFVQAQIINLFNQFQLCGCGSSVFNNGGASQIRYVDTTVRTNATTASIARFNPFTTDPVQGTNWVYGPNFGTALSRFAYTTPRMFRLTFGVRF